MAAKADARLYEPSPRAGHNDCSISDNTYVCFGFTGDSSTAAERELSRQVEVYDCYSKTWVQRKTTGTPPPGLFNGACTSIKNKLYTYGGGDSPFTGTLSQLDTSTMEWKLLTSDIGPMKKQGAGMIGLKNGNVALLGGAGIPTSPTQPGSSFINDTDGSGWTNEFHIFNISNGTWYSPPMTGSRPPPCCDFSFTTVDNNRAVVFGGLQPGRGYVNDVYILDFSDMNWTKIEPGVGEPWPVGRYAHAACCLDHGGEHPQLLISGGVNDDRKALNDLWLFNVASRKWKKLTLPDDVQSTRCFHSTTATTLGPGLVEVIMFGGSDDFENETLIAATTILRFKFIASTGEWALVDVVTNRQRATVERLSEKTAAISTKAKKMNKSHTPSVDSAESASLRETIGVLQQRVREAERRAGRAESASREAETTVQTVLQTVEDTRKEALTQSQQRQQAERRAQTAERQVQTANQQSQQAEIRAQTAEIQVQAVNQQRQQAETARREAETTVRELQTTVQNLQQNLDETRRRSEADLHAAEERRRETSRLLDEANQRAQNAERRALEAQARGREGEHWILQREEIVFTERELGRGGWGMVKVAKFRGINVAAKQLFQQISQFYRLSFIREMNMAARIRHPNLVQFIGATLDREPIILTELMSTSLRAVLERGPISHAQVVSISLDIARALNYLHLMKPDPIIHRDISSANVLLNPLPNNCWKAKISDYGSVNLLRQLNTVGPGSPVYAAPEAGIPASQSPKMDIFSFGVLLIEMITDTFPEVALRRTLIDSIQHRGLLELVQRCINEEKNNRPSSAEVITELSEI